MRGFHYFFPRSDFKISFFTVHANSSYLIFEASTSIYKKEIKPQTSESWEEIHVSAM